MAHPAERDLGFTATRAETLAIWEGSARRWASRGPPWRPSPGDAAAYRQLISAHVGGRVLLLGVTPELRDLLAELGCSPVLVDMSAAMRAATDSLLRRADPTRETWFESDWCEADLPHAFDLVLGDMIWWGVSVAKQHEVRETIHAVLKPDGLFVGRFRFREPARAGEDPLPVIARYVERIDSFPADARTIEGEMLSWIYDHTANRELCRIDRERARATLLRLAATPELSRHEELLRDASTRLTGADWTSQSREELLAVLRPRFEIAEEVRAEDYDSSLYPILGLRPRVD
jgi:SAM-dependent methyltransferase